MDPIRVLITGVLGLIGSNLSRALLDLGFEVYGVDNILTGKMKYLHPDVNFHRFDVSDSFPFRYTILPQKVDVIVHLASGKIPLEPGDANQVINPDDSSVEVAILGESCPPWTMIGCNIRYLMSIHLEQRGQKAVHGREIGESQKGFAMIDL